MRSSSNARVKCYIIMQGLERSLAQNLVRNYDLSLAKFLNPEEREKATKRLTEDQPKVELEVGDIGTDDLLPYLDLGDLVGLLNRHVSSATNIIPAHVIAVTNLIEKQKALKIRKRVMHPIRPLELDDLPKLMDLAKNIQKVAPSLSWDPLAINLRRISKQDIDLDIPIPTFWTEESPVVHNLPPAEFDDTGFIGRSRERRELRKLLESDHRVITVAGEGGIGKVV